MGAACLASLLAQACFSLSPSYPPVLGNVSLCEAPCSLLPKVVSIIMGIFKYLYSTKTFQRGVVTVSYNEVVGGSAATDDRAGRSPERGMYLFGAASRHAFRCTRLLMLRLPGSSRCSPASPRPAGCQHCDADREISPASPASAAAECAESDRAVACWSDGERARCATRTALTAGVRRFDCAAAR